MSVSHRGVRYTVPDTVSVKVKQRVKGLVPRILQEIRALTAHLPGIDAFRDAADMRWRIASGRRHRPPCDPVVWNRTHGSCYRRGCPRHHGLPRQHRSSAGADECV